LLEQDDTPAAVPFAAAMLRRGLPLARRCRALPTLSSRPTRQLSSSSGGGSSWVEGADGSHFPIQNLPYGVFSRAGAGAADGRCCVAVGMHVLDLSVLASHGLLDEAMGADAAQTLGEWLLLCEPVCGSLLAAGRESRHPTCCARPQGRDTAH
jgi:hypothetical protein